MIDTSREILADTPITLSPNAPLTCSLVESVALNRSTPIILSTEAIERVLTSRVVFDQVKKSGAPIYGHTTGFGPFVAYSSAGKGGPDHGAGLIAHLTSGSGDIAPKEAVRATMLIRAHTLAKGYSAIPLPTLEAYLALIKEDIIPAVPEIGSVGASGDLTPLAHIARVLSGDGYVRTEDSIIPASQALQEKGLSAIHLEGRDALALVNGTAFMSAYASLAVVRTIRLLHYAEALTGWMYRILGCRAQALDSRLHKARNHSEQIRSAARIRNEASRYGDWEDASRPLQEVYSFRCAAQVLGACRENIKYAQQLIETEINGITDNPVVVEDSISSHGGHVLHGGNFQGQQIAFAADALNAAITQMGVLVERQIAAILNPEINQGAPLLLAWTPGSCSGLAGGQITATALVAEMRHHASPSAITSIPTNGINQDIVSMGTMAARQAFGQTQRMASILSVAGIACSQLNALRDYNRAPGSSSPKPDWMPEIPPLEKDRGLWEEIEAISKTWLYNDPEGTTTSLL